MAKQRMINTRFWIDAYISNLDPTEKLLFLYLLTNTATDISGVYELPLKNMALDTGIEKEMVIKILDRFERDNKVFFSNGWVAVKNFQKHQLDNPKVQKGIENGLSKAPKDIIDRLSIDYEGLSHSNLNSNSNSNSNLNSKGEPSSQEIVQIIDSFKEVNPSFGKWYGNKTQRAAIERLLNLHGLERVLQVISILARSNKIPYIPTITTPVQLEDKWASLEAGLSKKKNELLVSSSKGRGIA